MSHNNRMANFETNLLDLQPGGGVRHLEQPLSGFPSLANMVSLAPQPHPIQTCAFRTTNMVRVRRGILSQYSRCNR